jgi:predicted ATPase
MTQPEIDQRSRRIERVELENYKSFAHADVDLTPLTVVVGPNSAGKSNFIDAFRFVVDGLRLGLPVAIERRGGFNAVRHRFTHLGKGRDVRIALTLRNAGYRYRYEVHLVGKAGGQYAVGAERCMRLAPSVATVLLEVVNGRVRQAPDGAVPQADQQLLSLPLLAGTPSLSPVASVLSTMKSCAIAPDRLREPQDPGQGQDLEPDGRNAASVLRLISRDAKQELIAVLARAVPGIVDVRTVNRGATLAIVFDKMIGGEKPLSFDAMQMSEGTLRLFGILLALHQPKRPSLLTIEEPEATLHFAAAQAMLETFEQHAEDSQIVFTTHSADVVDAVDIDNVRLVRSDGGVSIIERVAAHSASTIRDQLFTTGELLRAGGLRGENEDLAAT